MMNQKNKHTLCKSMSIFILANLLILSSCEQITSNNETTTAIDTLPIITTDIVDDQLPHYLTLEADFDGKTFTMLGIDSKDYPFFANFEIYSEQENGDVVNDAVFRRNQIIEERFNVTIRQDLVETPNVASNTAVFQRIKTEILTGDKTFDAFFIPSRDAALVMQNDFCTNLCDIDSIDLSESYWNQAIITPLTIHGELLLAGSDFSLVDKKRTYIMIYNNKLLTSLSDADLPAMVKDGSWTFDHFNNLAKLAYEDVNGDGNYDWQDQWGIGMGADKDLAIFFNAMGGKLVSIDKDGIPVITADNERNITIAEKIYKNFNENQTTAFNAVQTKVSGWLRSGCPAGEATAVAGYVFTSGRSLFISSTVQSLPSFSEIEDLDYRVVPFPKYDEQQSEYYSLIDPWGAVLFGIPLTSEDPEFPGFMLEVLSGYSTDTSYKAYVETASKIKYVYDPTSAEMLDIIFRGITVDVGIMYNFANMVNPIYKLMTSSSFSYVSDFAKIKSAAQSKMETIWEG